VLSSVDKPTHRQIGSKVLKRSEFTCRENLNRGKSAPHGIVLKGERFLALRIVVRFWSYCVVICRIEARPLVSLVELLSS
jgi:hypothetical protein